MHNTSNLKPWKPGQSGNPSGKRKRVLPRIDELLKKNNKEPIAELLALLPKLSDRDQVHLWLELLPYVHPKVKPSEDDERGEYDDVPTEELERLLSERMRKKAG